MDEQINNDTSQHELSTESDSVSIQLVEVDVLPDELTTPSTTSQLQLVPRSQPISEHRSHSKFGKKRKVDQFEKDVLELLKTEEDEFELFVKSLAPKLRRISEKDRKAYLICQNNINRVVFESEIELE